MDSKKVIERLVKIATQQQTIINKLVSQSQMAMPLQPQQKKQITLDDVYNAISAKLSAKGWNPGEVANFVRTKMGLKLTADGKYLSGEMPVSHTSQKLASVITQVVSEVGRELGLDVTGFHTYTMPAGPAQQR